MPGPSNAKKGKRRSSGSGRKVSHTKPKSWSSPRTSLDIVYAVPVEVDIITKTPPPSTPLSPEEPIIPNVNAETNTHDSQDFHELSDADDKNNAPSPFADRPIIEDPGNGPRVRDMHAFLQSYFAVPPSLDDPLCAEFAQDEILEMLLTVLPYELALVLWYNKSRATSRVCPSCMRLYTLGQVLAEHVPDEGQTQTYKSPSAQLLREQGLGGFCSPLCFVLACYGYPEAIKSAWGRTSAEMDQQTWELLNTQIKPLTNAGSQALGLVVRMTRLDDLGLAQLCLSEYEEPEGSEVEVRL
ncbi:hypothetical protein DL96DRAFT_1615551 [Flagelloscypha sp. PMI_526]|nr:hypothetical protein DL96DRAFT_1615551 [Flagelloscypha sp. PMI_526]